MSDLTQDPLTILIAGEEHSYAINMAALDAIASHGYSGKDGEGDFGAAFYEAETGDIDAQKLVAWAGLLPAFQDEFGAVDFNAAPPLSITGRMTFGELVMAAAAGVAAFMAGLPAGTVEAAEKAARAREEAEKAGRPTPPRKRSR